MKMKIITATLFTGALMLSTSASAQLFGGNNGNTLLGAGIGASLGGVLGSNLAGTGVQQEGTAIGALLGGIAGASLANSGGSRYGGSGSSGRYGDFVPAYGPGYGNGYGMSSYGAFGGSYARGNAYSYGYNYPLAAPMPAPQYIRGGSLVNTYIIPHTSYKVYHPAPAPKIKYEHIYQPQQVITKRIVHSAPAPKIEYEHVYAPAPAPIVNVLPTPTGTYCYAGSDKRYDRLGNLVSAGACN
ncbi:MAG: hypothetical protein L3J65_10820 [Robiginitomaculum sp.]|nr:hypothetical protein [Robiginitomaculum sp.]